MPRIPKSPIGLAWLLYRGWRRLPPAQRRQVLDLARRHGPTVAARGRRVMTAARKRR